MTRSARIRGAIVLVLLLVALLIWHAALAEDRRGLLTVSFLDVGQGDAIFIDAPSGRQVLVDGGRGRAVLRALARVSPWRDRSIDIVVATHPDADHIGGLPDVLARYHVSLIVESSVKNGSSSEATAFERATSREGAERLTARRGHIVDLGEGAYLEILFPDRDVSGLETNTGSIISRVVYGDTAFMLTGDAPKSIEEYLVRLGAEDLRADVLKAGHHGSKTSSSPLFMGFVNPYFGVFSRGCDNRYGHPHEEVNELFARLEIPTLDTCEDGTVTFVSDGHTVTRR